MALSIIGTPQAAASSSVTLPTHAIGDIIVIWAYRDGSTTTPSKPAAGGTVPAWNDLNNPTGANTNSARSAWFVATANNHTSGTWTNATGMAAIVIRGQHSSPIGGNAQSGSTGNGTTQAPAITLTDASGASIILQFFGHRTVTAWSAAPAGYTRQASVATEVALNTKDTTTTDGAISQSATTSNSGYRGEQIEILAAAAPTVTTDSTFTNIEDTTATGGGNVTSDGGSAITERGICWSTSANPTTSDSKATAAGTTGTFTAGMTSLTPGTTYHVRAYAINAVGTSYGSDQTFTTIANRYWVGGTANWDASTTTNWSATSGGAGGASVPTSTTNVIFNSSSNATAYTVTITATASCRNITFGNPASGALTLAGTSALNVSGNFAWGSGMTRTYTGPITMNGVGGTKTLTSNGITSPGFTFNGSGTTFQLQDDFEINVSASFVTTAGTFDANGKTVTLSGNNPQVVPTVDPNFYNLTVSPATPTKAHNFTINGNFTVTNLFTVSAGATATNRVLLTSNVIGSSRTITAASVSIANADFKDITGAGAASWNLSAATNGSGDCGGNSGITFTTPATQTYQGTASGSWSDVTKWTSRVPLPQDDVVISSSFTSAQITADMPRLGKSIDFTGSTIGTSLAWALTTTVSIFGSLAMKTGMTTSSSNSSVTFEGRSSYNLTSNGVSFTQAVNMSAPGGTITLQDAMTTTGGFTLTAGTFLTNDKTVTTSTASITGNITKALTLGTTTWNLTTTSTSTPWNVASTTGLTFSGASSTIVFSTASTNLRTFGGGGLTYGTITYTVANSPGAISFANNNTINTLNIGSGRSWTNTAGSNQTITNPNVSGAVNGYIYLPGVASNNATLPDSAALSVTGDIDIRVKAALDDWTPSVDNGLIAKDSGSSPNRSYLLYVQATTGKLVLAWFDSSNTVQSAASSVATGITDGTASWVRATLDVDDGAGNRVIKFYTSSDGSSWTQLGSTTTTAGTTSIQDGTASVDIGSNTAAVRVFTGKLYRAQIRNNILDNGTGIQLDADFSAKTVGANTFTESSSNGATVTINGTLAQAGDGRIILNSTTTGTHTLTKAGGGTVSSDYLEIQHSVATPGTTWYAGTHSINNQATASAGSGWIFTDPPVITTNGNFLAFF